MTIDTRQILLTASTYNGQIETANIVGNIPATSEITSGIPNSLPIVTQTNDTALNVTVTGMGEENIPDPRLFKFLIANFSSSEETLLKVYKNLTDNVDIKEKVYSLINKTVNENTQVSELISLVVQAYRNVTDSVHNIKDTEFIKILEKPLTADVTASVYEKIQKKIQTENSEYLSASETLFSKLIGLILTEQEGAYLAEDYTTEEYTAKALTVYDNYIYADVEKSVEELVDATDDFYGEATIGDDEYVVVNKALTEEAIILETIYLILDVVKTYYETTLISDEAQLSSEILVFDKIDSVFEQVLLNPNITAIDQIDIFEFSKFDIDHTKFDTATSVEQISLAPETFIEDTVTNTDEVIKFYQAAREFEELTDTSIQVEKLLDRVSADLSTTVELLIKNTQKTVANNTTSTLEQVSFDANIEYSDLIDATDDFYGSATTGDDEYALVDKIIADYVESSEAVTFAVGFNRILLELLDTDDLINTEFNKVLSDNVIPNEILFLEYSAIKVETSNVSELIENNVELTRFEDIVLSEELIQNIEPVKVESIVVLETVANDVSSNTNEFASIIEEISLNTFINRLDQIISTDFTILTVNIQLEEVINAAEEILTKDALVSLLDAIDATDDVFGAATINDDEYFDVQKVTVDYAASSEIVYIDTQTSKAEQTQVTDIFIIDTIKEVSSENVSSLETLDKEIYSNKYELLQLVETQSIDITKQFIDTITAIEDFGFNTPIDRDDIFGILDTQTFNINKQNNESLYTSEVISVYNTSQLQDLVDATDDVFGNATINDDEYFIVQKTAIDYTSILEDLAFNSFNIRNDISYSLDLLIFFSEKQLIDTLNISETISYDNQIYKSDSYSAIESVRLGFNKSTINDTVNKSDKVNTSMVLNKLEIATSIYETLRTDISTRIIELVDATDDFQGAATIGDDEYADFQKTLIDYAISSEIVTTKATFSRYYSESQILSEVFATATDKAISDITNSSDTVKLLAAASKSEGVATSQTISLTLQSYFSQDYAELGYTGETYTY